MTGIQLPFDSLPLDPAEVAKLGILERTKLYVERGLDPLQIASVEEAARQVIASRLMRADR